MRKNLLIGTALLMVSIPTFAGGFLTNTNQNILFLRMLARDASTRIDVFTPILPVWPSSRVATACICR